MAHIQFFVGGMLVSCDDRKEKILVFISTKIFVVYVTMDLPPLYPHFLIRFLLKFLVKKLVSLFCATVWFSDPSLAAIQMDDYCRYLADELHVLYDTVSMMI